MKKRLNLLFTTWAMLVGVGSNAVGSEIVVVMSSDSSPYQEALAGFQEAYGKSVDVVNLAHGEPTMASDTRIIVAIGGKAAIYEYSGKLPLVYCMAPGLVVSAQQHAGPRIEIHTTVAMPVLIRNLRDIQPGLKRLAIFWMADAGRGNFEYESDVSAMGVTLLSEHLDKVDELPGHLRALHGHADAIWITADPLIMTAQNFATTKEFCKANAIPLYVPVDSLADRGAAAAVSVSFREIGRTAAAAAKQALANHSIDSQIIFSDKSTLTLNLHVSAQSGLSIPPAAIKKADRVIP